MMPVEEVTSRILLIRGEKVMIDADLAELYGVSTKALNQAVKRNRKRFPAEFMFRLTKVEVQQVVTNRDHLARLIDAIRQLMRAPAPHSRPIGFTADIGASRKS